MENVKIESALDDEKVKCRDKQSQDDTKTSCNDSYIQTCSECAIPLNTSWTFWLDKSIPGSSAAEYKASLKKLYSSFWSVYNNLPSISELSLRYSYHLMRNERLPLWEDKLNCAGGNWTVKCHKSDTELVWQELLLAAIGEQFSDYISQDDSIGGITVSVREREDIVQIWNSRAELAAQATIMDKVCQLLPTVVFTAQFYKAFQKHLAYEGSKNPPD